MVKKILVISESINIEDSSASKVNVALILNLVKIGYNVKVVHFTRKNIQLDGIECISIPEIKFSFLYLLSRSQRVFQRITKWNISKQLERVLGHSFTFFNDSKSITKAVVKHYNCEDLIITLSKGASFRPHHAMLSVPELHSKWLAYVHDPFPFHFYPRPYTEVQPGYQFKEDFFRKVSEKAKYSGFPSLLLKEWMGSFFSNFTSTGIIIPHQNLLVEETFIEKDISYLEEDKFTILHAGNLMKQRPPHGLLKGFKLFLSKNIEAKDHSKLIFLGNGHNHQEFLLSEMNETVFWSQGNVPYSEVSQVQNSVSVNVILESKSEISPFLPGKFPHCVMANKPILLLGPYYSESKRLLGDEYSYISEPDNEIMISKKIEQLYINWKDGRFQKLDRPDLEEYVGVSFLKKQFDNILQS